VAEFKAIHLKRWSQFAKEAEQRDEITVFECAFLQNHIFELFGVYEKSDEEIKVYLSDLLDTVKVLNPTMIYIKPSNIEKVIDKAAEERKAPNASRRDWIDEIANWVENISYGKNHNLNGRAGVISFCKERLRIDECMISSLNIPVTIISRD
jgi:hypothetical protein